MSKYPVFLEMDGRRAVVIGGGPVALRKVQTLLAAGAKVTVAAETIDGQLRTLLRETESKLIKAGYEKKHLEGAMLAIAATNDQPLNKQIYKDCRSMQILCNVVDQPEFCDFFVPAVVRRGHLQIAISTDGDCPAYAARLREKLEKIFTPEHGQFLEELEGIRGHLIKNIPDPNRRKELLERLSNDESFEYLKKEGPARWRKWAEKLYQ